VKGRSGAAVSRLAVGVGSALTLALYLSVVRVSADANYTGTFARSRSWTKLQTLALKGSVHTIKTMKGTDAMYLTRNLAFLVLLPAALATNLAFAQSKPSAPNSKEERAIRDTDAAWSHAAETKDLDKTLSFYADDASVLPFNAPIANGRDQIREVWSHLMSMPGYSLRFAPTKIEVCKSKDMAFEIGTFQLTTNDAQGNPATTVGKYVVTWEKQAGQWKAAADIFNTDK